MRKIILLLIFFAGCSGAYAQQIRYLPKNYVPVKKQDSMALSQGWAGCCPFDPVVPHTYGIRLDSLIKWCYILKLIGIDTPIIAGTNVTITRNILGNTISASGGGGSGWSLTGNSGTTSANFLGTTDDEPLMLRLDNNWEGELNDDSLIYCIGKFAGQGNIGSNINTLGEYSAYQNIGQIVNAFGNSAAANNIGSNVEAIGQSSCFHNSGNNVEAIGFQTAYYNSFNKVIALGINATPKDSDELCLSDSVKIIHCVGCGLVAGGVLTDVGGTGDFTSQPPSGGGGGLSWSDTTHSPQTNLATRNWVDSAFANQDGGRLVVATDGTSIAGVGTVISPIAIKNTWAGQTAITTLGTIATGTWAGTSIAIAHGGTGQTTANTAFNALAPSQTSNSGKYLTTDGTNTSWGTPGGGSGTVTSVATGYGLSGGTITTTGTLLVDSAHSNGWGKPCSQKFARSLADSAAAAVKITTPVSIANGGTGHGVGQQIGYTLYCNDADSALLSVSNQEKIYRSILVPAGWLAANENIHIVQTWTKNGTTNDITQRIYVNSSNSLSGASLLAAYTGTTSAKWQQTENTFLVKSLTSIQGLVNTTGALSDFTNNASLPTNTTVANLSSNAIYILISGQLNGGTDLSTLSGVCIDVH